MINLLKHEPSALSPLILIRYTWLLLKLFTRVSHGELELDGNLSSISASIEGSLPENTAAWQAHHGHGAAILARFYRCRVGVERN